MILHIDGGRVTLATFRAALEPGSSLAPAADIRQRIAQGHATVTALAAGETPIYGLNTGLGGNVNHRLAADEIAAHQLGVIEGRAVAVGPALPRETGRATLLARILSAAQGRTGLSPDLFDHLVAVYNAGLSPVIPAHGSIGAGDLAQAAMWARAILGRGEMWAGDTRREARAALAEAGLDPPSLGPRDGLALVGHGGVTVALGASALEAARRRMQAARVAALMSLAGYGAHRGVLEAQVNALRLAPGQAETAAWLRSRLEGCEDAPRRIQEALSFRTLAPVLGAASETTEGAIATWEDEANGISDSPVLTDDGGMLSTANFVAPALSLSMESVTLAAAMVATGACQRIQRMMDPRLSGLPRYLSPVGGASAGMVPLQKTAMALLGEIRHASTPTALDPPPVSDTVEDMAPQTPAVARKLSKQMADLRLLLGAEALVAAQAIDLRGPDSVGGVVARMHARLRAELPPVSEDRPLGPEVEQAAELLESEAANI